MVGHDREQALNIGEMSERLGISFHYLTKILQSLTQAGLLASHRGPGGGISFLVPPEQIRLSDIVRILEGADFFDSCLLGLPGCGEQQPCPMHQFWAGLRAEMKQEFEAKTLAEMGRAAQELQLRLHA